MVGNALESIPVLEPAKFSLLAGELESVSPSRPLNIAEFPEAEYAFGELQEMIDHPIKWLPQSAGEDPEEAKLFRDFVLESVRKYGGYLSDTAQQPATAQRRIEEAAKTLISDEAAKERARQDVEAQRERRAPQGLVTAGQKPAHT